MHYIDNDIYFCWFVTPMCVCVCVCACVSSWLGLSRFLLVLFLLQVLLPTFVHATCLGGMQKL